jgi:hypothetical protein
MRPSPKIYLTKFSKPLTTPTSPKAMIYKNTTIGLVVLIHLLDDLPRHIRYRETLQKNAAVSEGIGQKKTRLFTSYVPCRDSGCDGESKAQTPPDIHRAQIPSTYRTEERRPRKPPPLPPLRRTYLSRPSPPSSSSSLPYFRHIRPPTPKTLQPTDCSNSRPFRHFRPPSSFLHPYSFTNSITPSPTRV